MQHQWFDITKSAHSYPKWEKSERNTREQKTYWDRSDRSSRPVWPVGVQRLVNLNWPVWPVWGTSLTGLSLTEQRLVFERGVFIPHTLTHSGVLMLLHSRAISEPWEHLRSPPQPLFVRFKWRRWLVNQVEIHSYANWRFKVTSSKRVCAKEWRYWCPHGIDRRKDGMIKVWSSSCDCGNCIFHLCTWV